VRAEISDFSDPSEQDAPVDPALDAGTASLIRYLELCQSVERQCRQRGTYFGVNDFILREGKI
jgi:hypothetical protein